MIRNRNRGIIMLNITKNTIHRLNIFRQPTPEDGIVCGNILSQSIVFFL
jgi:hypothetical protein